MLRLPMKTSTLAELEKFADPIRKELAVPRQNDVFRVATEAAYLAATTDGELDDDERATLIKAIGVLSVGAVIEWEAEALLDECAERVEKTGAAKRATAVGAELKELGQPEAGLLFAAFVAQASGGIDKKEAALLQAIGKAAGITKPKVSAMLKKVGAAADE